VTFWGDIESGGKVYAMSHLHPFEMETEIGGEALKIQVNFGWHVFTDEKGNGKLIRQGKEERYFSRDRYDTSPQAVSFIKERLIAAYGRPYYDKKRNENYFCLDEGDYALFLAIHKSDAEENSLKCRVISAYEVDSWGRDGLPKGKSYKMRWVLSRRNQGLSVK
jgi:hypothetical protein